MTQNVRLPRAIQRQAEAATQLQQDIPAAPAAPEPIQVPVPPAEPAPVPPQAVQAPVVNEPPPAPADPGMDQVRKYMDQRLSSVQGMLDSRIKTVAREAQVMSEQNQALRQQLEVLTKQLSAKPATPAPAVTPDPKDVESFGAELVEMVTRQAGASVNALIQSELGRFSARLDAIEQALSGVNQTVAATTEQTFYTVLEGRKPNWKAINQDPRFLEWLGTVDPIYRQPRQAALDQAARAGDVDAVVAIFAAFEQSVAPPPAAPAARSRQAELNSQVAPPATGSAPPPAQAQPQFIRAQDVHRFYDDVRRGKYRGRDVEMNQRELEINKAMAEGRIV